MAKRPMPAEREAVRNRVDLSGMDPEMMSTMKGEVIRKTKEKITYAPGSFKDVRTKGSTTAPKRKKMLGLF